MRTVWTVDISPHMNCFGVFFFFLSIFSVILKFQYTEWFDGAKVLFIEIWETSCRRRCLNYRQRMSVRIKCTIRAAMMTFDVLHLFVELITYFQIRQKQQKRGIFWSRSSSLIWIVDDCCSEWFFCDYWRFRDVVINRIIGLKFEWYVDALISLNTQNDNNKKLYMAICTFHRFIRYTSIAL